MSTQLPETFDPETTEGNTWELLPVGQYTATIVEIAVQQPKSGNGYYVAITWKIDEGEYDGRQVWQRITYIHPSEQAQTIGRKQLKDLCAAVGMDGEHVEDVEVFLFKRAKIKVGISATKTASTTTKIRSSALARSTRCNSRRRSRRRRPSRKLPLSRRRRQSRGTRGVGDDRQADRRSDPQAAS